MGPFRTYRILYHLIASFPNTSPLLPSHLLPTTMIYFTRMRILLCLLIALCPALVASFKRNQFVQAKHPTKGWWRANIHDENDDGTYAVLFWGPPKWELVSSVKKEDIRDFKEAEVPKASKVKADQKK